MYDKLISLLYIGFTTIHEENMAIARWISANLSKNQEKAIDLWTKTVDEQFKSLLNKIIDAKTEDNEVDDGK